VSAVSASRVAPGVLIGAEGRYSSKYEGLDHFAGQALFVGPTLYARLTKRFLVIAAWSAQVSGHAADSTGSLDLTRFERYQGKIQFGLGF
jgi:hypothetical protein